MFTEEGHPLQDLTASGPWRHEPHSLRLRQEVFKARRARQLVFVAGESPIETFVKLRRAKAPKSRRAASDLARVQRDRRGVPNLTGTAGNVPIPAEPSSQLASGPVKGKNLRITRGFARCALAVTSCGSPRGDAHGSSARFSAVRSGRDLYPA